MGICFLARTSMCYVGRRIFRLQNSFDITRVILYGHDILISYLDSPLFCIIQSQWIVILYLKGQVFAVVLENDLGILVPSSL